MTAFMLGDLHVITNVSLVSSFQCLYFLLDDLVFSIYFLIQRTSPYIFLVTSVPN